MKKLMTLIAISALATSGFGMAKAPKEDAGAACTAEEAIKSACCTEDGSCKKAKEAGETCTKEAEACTKKAEAAAAECTGGTCPLPK